jgi:4-carboxymuconolactone decarboxylase
MSRLDVIHPEAMSDAQRRVHDEIVQGPRGTVHGRGIGLSGPFNAWIRSPTLADHAQRLGAFLRFGTALPARLTELAIIVVGRHMNASFEFAAHAPLAIRAGLDPAIVEAIRTRAAPSFAAADEAAVYELAMALVNRHDVDDVTFARARDIVGEAGLVELVAIVGYYGMVSLTLNTFRVPLREDMVDPFADTGG